MSYTPKEYKILYENKKLIYFKFYGLNEKKYKIIVHAEVNAILFAKNPLDSTILYTYPFMPCSRCAGLVIQSGIKRVVSYKNTNPRWEKDFNISRQMFQEAGVEVLEYEPVSE